MPFKRRVLVTGGAGFVGSHLVEKLLNLGCEVICVDNFFSGVRSNVKHLLVNPDFELIRHEITEPLTVEVDEIYHLACPASPVHYQHNAIKTLKTNVLGTMNMLGLAKRTGAKFLLASTSEVYGDAEIHPQPETYTGNVNCIGRRSCYDEGKRAAEALTMDYHRQHRVDVRIARIFNTYGPRMIFNDGRVVSNFIGQALLGEPLSIYGDGSQTRSFCFIDDLVDGLICLMNSEVRTPVNLGNPAEFTIKGLAEEIQRITNSDISIVHHGLPSDDPRQRQPDISKAQKLLNWNPKVPLTEGLRITVKEFRERANANPNALRPVHQVEAQRTLTGRPQM